MKKVRSSKDRKRIIKSLGSAAEVSRLVMRTTHLVSCGVPTPPASHHSTPGEAAFPFLDGSAGLDYLLANGSNALAALLAPLAELHCAPPPDAMPPFDPFAKISPRLGGPKDDRLRELQGELGCQMPPGGRGGLIHGDFHVNQLVVDRSNLVWVLDLDDLALGPKEADVGNFAAHLATRPETRRDRTLRASFHDWLECSCAAYESVRGNLDTKAAEWHGNVALLRRGLKLRERGNPAPLDDVAAYLSGIL